jgi:2-hydroxy-3-keto-5-methylthiopentenyl-1-phosphate phosphatase
MTRGLHLFVDIDRRLLGGDAGEGVHGIDAGLADLLAFCREQGMSATIFAADPEGGLRSALHDAGRDDVRVVTEHVSWLPGNGATSMREYDVFPYANTECDGCTQCRRNIMLASAGEGDVLIYAGDGHGDPCPAEYADVVFARDALQTWCQQRNITHVVFRTYEDLRVRLASASRRRTLRPRPRAERKRREAFLVEA